MTPKEKEDNFVSYMPAYHFSFVTFQALSQLFHYSLKFSRIAIKKVKSCCFKRIFQG